jgi:drug/metabolite transporter (DMT)-like permease
MTLDIRIPIGLLFAILGALLVAYGLISDPKIYQRSLDININLWWGLVMLLFGGLMIFLGRQGARASQE